MKISCIPLCFSKEIKKDKTMSVEDWIQMAVELNLDATEMYEPYIRDLDADGMARLSDTVHEAGLEVSMFTPESNFSNPDEREQEIANTKRHIDAAKIFKTNIVRITGASHTLVGAVSIERGEKRNAAIESIAEGLKGCLDYAEDHQVMLALEDHPAVGTNIADFMKMIELIDDDRLKVNLDTANVRNTTTVELAEKVADRVVHTHISELLDNKHGVVIGKGEVDFKGIFNVLKNQGYDGWISLEPLTGGKEDLRFSIEHIRSVWNSQ